MQAKQYLIAIFALLVLGIVSFVLIPSGEQDTPAQQEKPTAKQPDSKELRQKISKLQSELNDISETDEVERYEAKLRELDAVQSQLSALQTSGTNIQ